MYTLKGISFVANASLFDISIIFFCFLRVFFCAEKNKKKKQKRRWTLMEFKNETQTEKFTIMFLSFDRSISSFFLCACCVCFGWTFCRFLVRVYIEKKESYVPPENVGTRWDVTTFFTKASSFYASSSSSSSSSFLRFWTFPPRFSRRLRRSRRRRGAKRPRRRRERVLAPFREVRRRF